MNIERIQIPGLPRGGAYADAVRHDNLIFLSGLVGVDADMILAGDDAAAQTHRIMVSLRRVLDHFGTGFEQVLKITTYLTDIKDREAVAEVRNIYFADVRPAATLVAVSALVLPEWKVEMDFILAVP